MINTDAFGAELLNKGFTFFSGVPCSYLKDLINFSINKCNYVPAANEGDALAIAAGASLAGARAVVLMQNSGLSNAVSPLVSLLHPFRIPVLGFVSLRGEPGKPDEPQHELMGRITADMLDLMQIRNAYLSDLPDEALRQLEHAVQCIDDQESFFFIVRKGTFSETQLHEREPSKAVNQLKIQRSSADQLPKRIEALHIINQLKDNRTVLLATTGKTGRELNMLEDAANHLYMVGSMGCIGSLALGLALAKPAKDVIAIDGDGALLMRMGSLAVNGYCSPPNMLHILLDNQTHDSTGGQQTVAHQVDFINVAAACGYVNTRYIHTLEELEKAIQAWRRHKGLTFLYMRIARGSEKDLGRPGLKPHEVKERMQVFMHD